jgi:hypothetical protein
MTRAPPVAMTVAPLMTVVMMMAAAEPLAEMHERGGGLLADVSHGGLRGRCEGDEQCQREERHGKDGGLFHRSSR